MNRVKTFNATGIAPAGRLYAGDLNAIQDAAAALTDLTQNVSVASLAVGEAGLVISRYGAGEFRMVGAVRTDGVVRGLGGLFAGTFTTTARDSIPAGATPQQKPYGLVITNTTTNTLQWNRGTDAAPAWTGIIDGADSRMALLSVLSAGVLSMAGDFSASASITAGTEVYARSGSASLVRMGATPGGAGFLFGAALDTSFYRSAAGVLATPGAFIVSGALSVGSLSVAKSIMFGIQGAPYTANVTLVDGSENLVITDTHVAAFTITLPAAPSIGTWFEFVDVGGGAWATNNLTIGHNGKNIDFLAADLVLTGGLYKRLIYTHTGYGVIEWMTF